MIILHYNIDKKNNYLFFDNISKFKINDIVLTSSNPAGIAEEVQKNLK
jgi:hypothetical protein